MGEHTLHLKLRPSTNPGLPEANLADSQIDVDLRVHGKRFVFRFDIPDAQGAVPITDIDRQRMLTKVMNALDGKFGKIKLRAEL